MQATNIIITVDHVDITLSNDVQRGDTLNTQYIPGTNKVQDLSGNEAAAFNLPVTIELWPNGNCTDLLLTVIDYQTIQADWINGSTDETGIIAEISTDQVTWIPTTLASGTETNNFTGLTASTLYYVQVRAVKNGYYSDYTDTESATTESDIPAVISDGNTVLWLDSSDLTTITKDASDFVSQWVDKLLSGRKLTQATGSKQPKWVVNDGVLFDAVDDFMSTGTITLNQPEFIYIVFRTVTYQSAFYISDGRSVNRGSLTNKSGGASEYLAYAGASSTTGVPYVLNEFHILRLLFNGASSKLQRNTVAAVTGNFGTNNMEGFILGATQGGSNPTNIQVKEVIIRKIADNSTDETAIYNYLANKYSIT